MFSKTPKRGGHLETSVGNKPSEAAPYPKTSKPFRLGKQKKQLLHSEARERVGAGRKTNGCQCDKGAVCHTQCHRGLDIQLLRVDH